eukprot:gene17239-20239_t
MAYGVWRMGARALIRGGAAGRAAPIGHIFTQDGEWGKGAASPWTNAAGKKIAPSAAPAGCSEPAADVVAQARQ